MLVDVGVEDHVVVSVVLVSLLESDQVKEIPNLQSHFLSILDVARVLQ